MPLGYFIILSKTSPLRVFRFASVPTKPSNYIGYISCGTISNVIKTTNYLRVFEVVPQCFKFGPKFQNFPVVDTPSQTPFRISKWGWCHQNIS